MNANPTFGVDPDRNRRILTGLRTDWQNRAEAADLQSRTAADSDPNTRKWQPAARDHREMAASLDRQAQDWMPARDAARRREETATLGQRVQTALDLENRNYDSGEPPPANPDTSIGAARKVAILRRGYHAHVREKERAYQAALAIHPNLLRCEWERLRGAVRARRQEGRGGRER